MTTLGTRLLRKWIAAVLTLEALKQLDRLSEATFVERQAAFELPVFFQELKDCRSVLISFRALVQVRTAKKVPHFTSQ
jgi:hypothetical protein